MRSIGAIVLAAILAVAVGVPHLRAAPIENEAGAGGGDDRARPPTSNRLPMYPPFGPPTEALPSA